MTARCYARGITIKIEMDTLRIGQSFFIPVVEHRDMLAQLKYEFESREWEMSYKLTIERGMLGLRIWRVK